MRPGKGLLIMGIMSKDMESKSSNAEQLERHLCEYREHDCMTATAFRLGDKQSDQLHGRRYKAVQNSCPTKQSNDDNMAH